MQVAYQIMSPCEEQMAGDGLINPAWQKVGHTRTVSSLSFLHYTHYVVVETIYIGAWFNYINVTSHHYSATRAHTAQHFTILHVRCTVLCKRPFQLPPRCKNLLHNHSTCCAPRALCVGDELTTQVPSLCTHLRDIQVACTKRI